MSCRIEYSSYTQDEFPENKKLVQLNGGIKLEYLGIGILSSYKYSSTEKLCPESKTLLTDTVTPDQLPHTQKRSWMGEELAKNDSVIRNVLQTHKKDCPITTIIQNEYDGITGVLSQVQFIKVKFLDDSELNVVCKTYLPSVNENEDKHSSTFIKKMFEMEMNFYKLIHPELVMVIDKMEYRNPLPQLYYAGETTKGSLLLENLVDRNLHLASLNVSLNHSQIEKILASFAVVQFSALSLQMKYNKGLGEIFPFLKVARADNSEFLNTFWKSRLETFLVDFEELSQDVSKGKLFLNHMKDDSKSEYTFEQTSNDFTFLSHGDFWCKNIFLDNESSVLIDWQFVSCGNISDDVSVLVLTGIDSNASIILEYTNNLDRLKCLIDKHISNDEMKKISDELFNQIRSKENIIQSLCVGLMWIISSWEDFQDISVKKRLVKNIDDVIKYFYSAGERRVWDKTNVILSEIFQGLFNGCDVREITGKAFEEETGFLSTVKDIGVVFSDGRRINAVSKTLLPATDDNVNQSFVIDASIFFENEMFFYKLVYPKLSEIIEEMELQNPFPKLYFAGETEMGSLLLLENLLDRGLYQPPMSSSLSHTEMEKVLTSLAAVQVSVLLLQIRCNKGLGEIFPFLKVHHQDAAQTYLANGIDWFIQDLKKYVPDFTNYIRIVRSLEDEKWIKRFPSHTEKSIAFLGHGDLWNYNVFLGDDVTVIIDWQFVNRGSIVFDIGFMVLIGMDTNGHAVQVIREMLQRLARILDEMCADKDDLRELATDLMSYMMMKDNFKIALVHCLRFFLPCWDVYNRNPENVKRRTVSNICDILDFIDHL